jgi:NTE family protein
MPEAALVLSGGGAKGAFQVTAEKYLREKKDYTWKAIAGVSVGALNALMLGMGKYAEMEEIWNNITREQVMTGRFNLWSLVKMKLFGAKAIYGNEPLQQLLAKHYDQNLLAGKEVVVGAVSLVTGDYKSFRPSDEGFLNAVLASTAIPVFWDPVDVNPSWRQMVDGGVRNITPLGDVLGVDPQQVVVINCSPRTPPKPKKPLENGFDIGLYSLDIMMNEILQTDIKAFKRINKLVEAYEPQKRVLSSAGEEFKHYDLIVIEPDKPLGDTLDFSRETLNRSMQAGEEAARLAVP